MRKRTALLSVYNKDGIADFARDLVALGFDIISSGGTAKALREAGIPVKDVAELVGGGAILGHRVVTLSREVHAGLLARDTLEDNAELKALGIPRIDLVYVDLYPLEEEIENPEATRDSVIEKTDIGGPTILRSAAKGRRIVIADPHDRARAILWLKKGMPDAETVVTRLCAKAEGIIADYCLASAGYHSDGNIDGIIGTRVLSLCYGENRHQEPADLFQADGEDPLAIHRFKQIGGSAPSYINVTDMDRLLQTMTRVLAGWDVNDTGGGPIHVALAVKHGNVCGFGVGHAGMSAVGPIKRMIDSDPASIMGGWIMCNFPISEEVAETLRTYRASGKRNIFDGIVAPAFDEKALEILERKAGKCRMFVNPALASEVVARVPSGMMLRPVRGGFLRQPRSEFVLDLWDERAKTYGPGLSPGSSADLSAAWAIGSTANSNTITLVGRGMLIANAVGQQSRVRAAKLALMIAKENGHDVSYACAYSDSFFPFPDGVKTLTDAGVRTIFASSGSVNDPDVIKHCEDAGVTFVMMPDSVCRGFSQH